MSVIITGRIGDSAGEYETGRIEFSQAQRLDTGELLVTQSIAIAQVVQGELRTLDGSQFSLPVNPEGTAVRVREILGGRTFEWWTAVPEADAIEYRQLPIMESAEVPASVWGPPPWMSQIEQMRDETIQAVADGTAVADALGGLAGITQAVTDAQTAQSGAEAAAGQAADSAGTAASEADRAEAAASSVDMTAINQRLDGMDTSIGTKVDHTASASRLYGTTGTGAQTTLTYGQSALASSIPQRGTGGRLPGIGAPTQDTDAATKRYVDDAAAALAARDLRNPYLGQASLYSYGHSFTSVPNNYCRPNYAEHPLRLRELLGFADVLAYGRGGTPLPDTLANALNNSRVTDKNRNWPGLDTIASSPNAETGPNDPDERTMPRGVVTIQNYINEIGLGYTSPAFIEFWKQCLRSLIAVVSGKAQRAWSTDISGTWNESPSAQLQELFPKGQLPAGLLTRSATAGDWRQFRVRGDSCWVFTLATKGTVTSGDIGVYVGSTKVQTISPQGECPSEWESVIEASSGAVGWPVAYKVTGLNAAAGTAGWKTVRLRVEASEATYLSVVLVERLQPPEVFVAYEPKRKDTAPATWATENAKYKAAVDQVVAEFTNAHIADLDVGWDNNTMTPNGNFHPNDRGQAQIAANYVAAINAEITDWNPGAAVL